jgi:hypothetical protein
MVIVMTSPAELLGGSDDVSKFCFFHKLHKLEFQLVRNDPSEKTGLCSLLLAGKFGYKV